MSLIVFFILLLINLSAPPKMTPLSPFATESFWSGSRQLGSMYSRRQPRECEPVYCSTRPLPDWGEYWQLSLCYGRRNAETWLSELDWAVRNPEQWLRFWLRDEASTWQNLITFPPPWFRSFYDPPPFNFDDNGFPLVVLKCVVAGYDRPWYQIAYCEPNCTITSSVICDITQIYTFDSGRNAGYYVFCDNGPSYVMKTFYTEDGVLCLVID
jgi:hypothetical protein